MGKPLSEEQKALMAEGRHRAREKKLAEKLASEDRGGEPALPASAEPLGEGDGHTGDDAASESQAPLPAASETEANDPAFELFLASIDAETRELLSDNELADIYLSQLAKAKAEKKAAAKKRILDTALHVARIGEGLMPAAAQDETQRQRRMNELVTWTPDLPEYGDIGMRIDGRLFRHGVPITTTRAVFDSCRDMMYRAADAELLFEGKSRKKRQWLLGRAMGTVERHIEMQ